jgi:hypothetical protein
MKIGEQCVDECVLGIEEPAEVQTDGGAIIGGMSKSVRAARRPVSLPLIEHRAAHAGMISTAMVAAVKMSWSPSDCWKSELARVSIVVEADERHRWRAPNRLINLWAAARIDELMPWA